ncbi:MAG: hypothetical protein HY721_34560 [Planctomycetes bacterium]|nr:hypothetical protein [Planctomycetota bacterium]
MNAAVQQDGDGNLVVTWENPPGAPAGEPISILADYVEVGIADGAATSFTFYPTLFPPGAVDVCVVNWSGFPDCAFHVPEEPAIAGFLRADSNATGEVDISDAVFTLARLFTIGEPFPCEDAADSNDDGAIDISDPIAVLAYSFLGAVPPAPPFPACGADPSGDGLSCRKGSCVSADACACKEHKLRKVYINTVGMALPRGTMHFYTWLTCTYTWLTCTKTTARDECEGSITVTIDAGKAATQTRSVPCDGERHTASFKGFKLALTPNTTYSIKVTVTCGGASSTSKITVKVDANGNIDPAQSDQDGDGKLDKDDKNPADPD